MLESKIQSFRDSHRVLLVEDNPADVALVQAHLGKGWQIDVANSLHAALERLAHASYDFLLVDLTLPDASRLDSVRRLRREAPDLPIVVLSGDDDPNLGLRVVQCGAEIFVHKNDLGPLVLAHALLKGRRKKLEQRRSMYLAGVDSLTGLANERRFLDVLRTNLTQSDRALSVVRIDVDGLASMNAALGENVGDELLKEVAWRLGGLARHTDVVARLGDDDFVILLANIAEIEILRGVGQRILEHLARPFTPSTAKEPIDFSCSVGVAVTRAENETVEAVLLAAEGALIQSKGSSGNAVTVQPVASPRQAASDGTLERALARGEFKLAFQPQYSLKTSSISGFEALIRWQPESGPMVMPAAFIPQLEATDLIIEVGRWVLETACTQLRRLRETTGRTPQMAINVSAREFLCDDFVKSTVATLLKHGIDPHQLELEITESVVMQDCEQTQRTLTSLRAHGIRIALDDFGTGYSALSYLHRFPVDVLKLDRSLVSCVREVGCGAMIASAIIQLAHNLGMTVVGEGVETDAEAEFLRTEGCDIVQGYLYGRPKLSTQLETHEAWTH